MCPKTSRWVRGLLLGSLIWVGSGSLNAQFERRAQSPAPSVKSQAKPEEQREPESVADQQEREQLDRELIRLRASLTRDAIARMREGRNQSMLRVLNDVGAFLIFLTILGSLLWILRVVLDTRRWNKVARVQQEVHTKLLEKFASSQDLLAYMNTEAGKRFLESTPLEIEQRPSTPFPYGRILWSVQAGILLALLGAALLYLRNQVPEETQFFLIFGTLTLTLGVGFVLSSGISYVLSRSFGLLEGMPGPTGSGEGLTSGRQ